MGSCRPLSQTNFTSAETFTPPTYLLRSATPLSTKLSLLAIKTKPPPKGLRKDQDKGRLKATERIKTPTPANDRPKCLYCGRTGHSIIDCFKLLAAQAFAKSDGAPDKKKAAVAFHTSTLDYFDDEDTKYLSSHVWESLFFPWPSIGLCLGPF